jgi:metal-responsive CopG/Arc/MetJ family transcriptional regulator
MEKVSKYVSVEIPISLNRKIEEICKRRMKTKSDFVRDALFAFVDNEEDDADID